MLLTEDFNAKVENDNRGSENVMERNSLGERNENADLVLQLRGRFKLKIA